MRRTMALIALAACALGAFAAGSPPAVRDGGDGPPPVIRGAFAELRGDGLSGGTAGDDGAMWAIAEERRELHRFDRWWSAGSHVRVPLLGVEPHLELESAAWLGEARIALGTERDTVAGGDDLVLVARVDGDTATVIASSPVPFGAVEGAASGPNQGVEGLCAAGDTVLAASERVEESPEGRLAPLARTRHHRGGLGPWEPLRLRLTTATGKISALDCAVLPGGAIEVHAVERHYGVTRVLRFHLPEATHREVIEPDVVADLAAVLRPLPNVEALVLEPERLWMVSDHDPDDAAGTTELLRLDAPVAVARIAR